MSREIIIKNGDRKMNETLKKIDYNRVLCRKVMKNNATSGKIYLPKELIGKDVHVVVEEK